MSLPPAAQVLVEYAKRAHEKGRHVEFIDVIEHPNYGPYVKLVCKACVYSETYVRIVPE